jgi:uncharacterized membrane protein SpoIIM required for sporulation
MVFEQLFGASWMERKPFHSFILGVIYSIFGLVTASIIFGASTGLMAVAFTSILLIPSLNQLLQDEENVEIREKKYSIKLLFKDHRDIFEIYIFMFFGIFLVFSITSVILPQHALLRLFPAQLTVAGITGKSFSTDFFIGIILNNSIVLIATLVLSLVYGAGSILFITWNASAWGVIFGYFAHVAANDSGANPFMAFISILVPVLPHMITEATSYFSACIAGGVVSKAVLREKIGSEKFNHVISDALILAGVGIILVVVAALIEAFI